MIKVCHISTVHPLLDDRIFYKECISLVQAGYDVSLVITHTKQETIDGVKIIPLKESKGRIHRILIKSFIAFRKALKTKSKLYHFHDPELIFVGIMLKIVGKKVIFDSHENVSKQIESKAWIGSKVIRKIVAKLYRLIEMFGIFTFNSVISVTPEIVSFLSSKKGILIRNFPIISLIDNSKNGIKNLKTTLIYAGGLTKVRGIKELCEAISYINKDVHLQLLGPWESNEYKEECIAFSPNKIEYVGTLPMDDVYPYIKEAAIGIATLYPEKNYLNSLPIKAFEYMTCEKPIVMSNFPYWEKEFKNCAIFVDPKNPEDIANKIINLIDDKETMLLLGKTGRKLVEEKYSWESESKKMVDLYDHLLKNN
jgi:glycosyltransferase involved in cell wall biosynthesis